MGRILGQLGPNNRIGLLGLLSYPGDSDLMHA
jgi:hypothetical protein